MQLIYDVGGNHWTSYAGARWQEKVTSQKLTYLRESSWQTAVHIAAADDIPAEFSHLDGDHDHARVIYRNEVLTFLTYSHGNLHVRMASDKWSLLADELARWEALFPHAEADDAVQVKFWFLGPHGPRAIARLVKVPEWADIAGNYSHKVQAPLSSLITGWRPSGSGQLLLWHGPAGTGKTYALRALIKSWSSWCAAHFITDPDNFFGHNLDYLMNCVVSGEDDGGDAPPTSNTKGKPERWRLLILEDAGELLVPDAREHVGQGLSRLLNLVDGLLGQGLRLLVLITTNEPLQKMHPAVARPGRCASRIEFGPLSAQESADWLTAHDVAIDRAVVTARPLAELYAQLQEQTPSTAKGDTKLGFAGTGRIFGVTEDL